MLNSFIQFFSPWRRQLQVPLTGLLLTAGIWVGEAKLMLSNELESSATLAPVVWTEALGKEVAIIAKRDALQSTAPTGKLPEKDGIYLYGQSPEPEQIGQEYMVFEVRQGKVIGAIYMPYSEFSCFYGTLQSGKLAMMVASSPDDEAYPDPVAESNSQRVATANDRPHPRDGYNPIASPYSVALQDYHQLASVSANDQRILETCKAN